MTELIAAPTGRVNKPGRRTPAEGRTGGRGLPAVLAARLDGEFRSGEPERVWAAACSLARVMCRWEPWVDSTAIHEASCGAWEAVSDPTWSGFAAPVPAALAGARRSLLLERVARGTVFRPGVRTATRLDREICLWGRVLELDEATDIEDPTDPIAGELPPEWMRWLADALDNAGWGWPVPPLEGLRVALEAVVDVGRDRAPSRVRWLVPELPSASAAGLVTLIAGSRQRDRKPWPGLVWLVEHRGLAGAVDDPAIGVAVASVVAGTRCFPSRVSGAAVHVAARRPTPAARTADFPRRS